MNYIRHLNAFFSFVRSDDRLACSHVSLYLALFQYWNFNRFQNPFPVYRDNLMNLSKIGSKNTYHKCIKELHEAKYIFYQPTASKFLPVRISVIRLDIQEEQPERYKQLDLFAEESSTATCPKNETDSVPNLSPTSTDFDTVPVPKVGHNIKHKHFNKTESKHPAQKKSNINENRNAETDSADVSNSGHDTERSRSVFSPTLSEVEEFFKSNNYPINEAKKFFNHYKGIGWKIKGITPIEDWQAVAHKWMLNAGKFETKQDQAATVPEDIRSLYKQFQAGQNIFKHITADHFAELNLEVTEEIMAYAWQERIDQLIGSNQNSILQLLQAYEEKKDNDPLLINDKDNLISLAKRIAVFKHFQTQKR